MLPPRPHSSVALFPEVVTLFKFTVPCQTVIAWRALVLPLFEKVTFVSVLDELLLFILIPSPKLFRMVTLLIETPLSFSIAKAGKIDVLLFKIPAYSTMALSMVPVDEKRKRMNPHLPADGEELEAVKVTCEEEVPVTFKVPRTSSHAPDENFTVAPASKVTVTPELMVVGVPLIR